MQTWQWAWQTGVAPLLSTRAIEYLHRALLNDDPRLLQDETVLPRWTPIAEGLEAERACVIGFCAIGDGKKTVGAICTFFGMVCNTASAALGEPSAVRYFLNWYDETPRDEMRRELLAEVAAELERREASAA